MRILVCALFLGLCLGVLLNPLTSKPATPGVPRAIRKVFGYDAPQALRVSWCESRWYVWAQNGSHLGVFQLGGPERARFQRGIGYWAQIRAAHRYFVLAGWVPWVASEGCWARARPRGWGVMPVLTSAKAIPPLLDLEGARVETVTVDAGLVKVDLRFKGTDDGAARLIFGLDSLELVPWNPDLEVSDGFDEATTGPRRTERADRATEGGCPDRRVVCYGRRVAVVAIGGCGYSRR